MKIEVKDIPAIIVLFLFITFFIKISITINNLINLKPLVTNARSTADVRNSF
tara:strand:+ start:578 stop:733 length:156 start_codon:yes stop_codon:yes gene_type:complete